MSEPPIVTSIVREHAELAAFLWAQRETLMEAEVPDSEAIAALDKRIVVHLEGLRVAGQAAQTIIMEQYEDYPEDGELFLATFFSKIVYRKK